LVARGGILEYGAIRVVLMGWQSVVDFLVLTGALYVLLRWAQQARALRVALLVAGLHFAAVIARSFDLVITSWLLDGTAILAVILLLLVFQAELRRFFMRLEGILSWRWRTGSSVAATCQAISQAAFRLASESAGALIVIARRNPLGELVSDGIGLDAAISPEILQAIFQKTSPIHDGAVIVRGDHLVRAGTVLPLTERERVPSYYGTRHRAAMGLAERCDALVLVVSEERGEVTLMEARRILRVDDPEKLAQILEKLSARQPLNVGSRLRDWLFSNLRVKLVALGLAALIWSTSFVAIGTTVRTINVPVEFVGVPGGMDISLPSADHIEVQVRGSPWLMDSVSLTRQVARFNLSGARSGSVSIPVDAGKLQLPPGIIVDSVSPARITVRITPRKKAAGNGRP
jgi:diadenylate cyclase